MTTKRAVGPGTVEIDGEKYGSNTFEYDGDRYTMRELSVDEGDEIWDAAQEPIDIRNPASGTKTNGRMNSRMLLARALVEPIVTVDQVGKWGGRKYVTLMREFDRLNTVPEANPTQPAGSAGLTSPAGGAPSPTA